MVTIDMAATADVVTKAQARGIPVIEYDRLTAGGNASYFVGFDPAEVGRSQAEGLIRCLDGSGAANPVVAELNGPAADAAVSAGYELVLAPRYETQELVRGPDDQSPPWRGARFDQMMARTGNRIDAVLAGSDALADGAIAVLRNEGLNGKVPVVGRGATLSGLAQHPHWRSVPYRLPDREAGSIRRRRARGGGSAGSDYRHWTVRCG